MRSLLMVGSLCAVVMMFTGCATVGNSGGCSSGSCGLQSRGDSAIGSNCQARQAARQERRQMRDQSDCGCNDSPSQAMESYEMPADDCGCSAEPVMAAPAESCGCSECAAAVAPAPAPVPTSSDCGCSECASAGQSTGGLLGRMRDKRMAMRLSEKGSDCADEAPAPVADAEQTCSSGTCGSETCSSGACSLGKRRGSLGNNVRPCGGQAPGGRVAQAGGHFAGGHFAGGGLGCGHRGCGTRGQLCSSCGLKSRLAGGHFGGGHLGGHHTKPYAGAIPHTAAPSTFNGGPGGGGVPQYVYPYYTTRGPRDFLMSKPPSIGP